MIYHCADVLPALEYIAVEQEMLPEAWLLFHFLLGMAGKHGVGPGSTTSGTCPLLTDLHHACIAPTKGIPQVAMIGKA